ncbi:retrovirus-related Pol polyprotein from transposon TNT 1-94 [Trichonephila clavipes]|nr:retrovirus-related Pol polyprotein from transposon TNT 1-94 [Trichonephila clavipes]
MENELDSLDKHKVWEIVQKPAKSKLIKTKWAYSLKQDDAGKNIKYKARLVAAGFNQIKNIDYSKSYSPVVNIESFRLLIALAAKLKLNVNFFDVKTAYLYGDLEETVYVLPPPGYEKLIGDDKVCKSKKSIYSLPQSGRNCSDASWGNAENGKSFSGGVVLLGNSLILWKCRKQKSVSLSTCEAELFSISEICKDIIWTVNLLTELKCEQFINNTVTLNSDSQAAIQWIKSTRSSNKSRHMNLRFHFIKDLIEDTVIKLEYVQTEFLIADFLTKAMNVEKLEYSMQKIALLS